MTDEVSYRHWTFDDDNVEYTEPSYMMVFIGNICTRFC